MHHKPNVQLRTEKWEKHSSIHTLLWIISNVLKFRRYTLDSVDEEIFERLNNMMRAKLALVMLVEALSWKNVENYMLNFDFKYTWFSQFRSKLVYTSMFKHGSSNNIFHIDVLGERAKDISAMLCSAQIRDRIE